MAPDGVRGDVLSSEPGRAVGAASSIDFQAFHAYDLTRSGIISTNRTVEVHPPSPASPVELCPRRTRRNTPGSPKKLRTIAPRFPTTSPGFRKRFVEARKRGFGPSRPSRAFRYQTTSGRGLGNGATGRKRRGALRGTGNSLKSPHRSTSAPPVGARRKAVVQLPVVSLRRSPGRRRAWKVR